MPSIIKSFFITLSMYSKIPVPQFEWKEKDMRYCMCFFPLVGVVVAALCYAWIYLGFLFDFNFFLRTLVLFVIPVIVTGGIHLDGFMDTSDALSSYGPKENKLEILKDSHIGAFAVIHLLIYTLIFVAALSEVDMTNIFLWLSVFVLSRIFSAFACLIFPTAKKSGTLFTFANNSEKKISFSVLVCELICISVFELYFFRLDYLFLLCSVVAVFFYYRFILSKKFGGITGDLAGWFVSVSELFSTIVFVVCKNL